MIKVGTDFSGIGSPEQALKNLGIKHSVEFSCEIDKYAKETYLANHTTKKMYDDITIRNHSEIPQLDLYVAGFPCQAFSLAGKRKGFEDVRGTLFFNVAEFIKTNQPKCFILENVKGLLSHDKGKTFQTIIDLLSNCGGTVNGQMSLDFFEDGLGYHIYYKVLNTKEHGIPQNRERIFIVGFKDYRDYRFPIKEKLNLKLKDILEDDVDKKYYLSDKLINYFVKNTENNKEKGNTQAVEIVASRGRGENNEQQLEKRKDGCSNSLTSVQKDNLLIMFGTGKNSQGARVYSDNGLSCTISSGGGGLGAKTGLYNIEDKIRRLTPLECFRLQGFPDNFIKPCSDTQLYKQAGNSITVNVIQKVINNI